MLTLLGTALATALVALSLVGIVAGGVRSGSAMRDYSRGSREVAEDFNAADLDQIQSDQRTAPIEVAEGLAQAAANAQTLSSPDVPGNPIPLGFTDGMSIGQLVIQDSDTAANEQPEADPEAEQAEATDFSGLTWILSIEVDGEWQPGVGLRLEGTEGASLETNPVATGTYVFDEDETLYLDLVRNYPVQTSAGTVTVPEHFVISVTVAPDFSIEGQMTRDNWQVNDDGSKEIGGLLNYRVRGSLVQ